MGNIYMHFSGRLAMLVSYLIFFTVPVLIGLLQLLIIHLLGGNMDVTQFLKELPTL
jgi:ABC-type maltose transport system permease subunit